MSPAAKEPDQSTYSGRFAARLRMLREKAGLSVGDVAQVVEVPNRTYYGWENGSRQPPFDVLPKIAETLKVKPRTLMPAD